MGGGLEFYALLISAKGCYLEAEMAHWSFQFDMIIYMGFKPTYFCGYEVLPPLWCCVMANGVGQSIFHSFYVFLETVNYVLSHREL